MIYQMEMSTERPDEQALTGPVRVLFLSDHLGYADGVIHGATTYFLNVLPALSKAGVFLKVCFLRGRHPIATRLEAEGIEPEFLERGKWDLRALGDLTGLIREHKIDIVHAAGMKGILLGRVAARMTGARFLAHLHDTNPLDPLTRRLHCLFAPWTDGALGISRTVCDYGVEVMGLPRDRIRLLYNALPLERYAPLDEAARRTLRASLGYSGTEQVMGIIGRLSPEKGHASFLRQCVSWLKARPSVRLLIVGDGPERTSLQHIVIAEGVSQQVRFAGHRDDVPALLSILSALIVPSQREGLGYMALEAMAAGCPVAAYRVGGLAELIEDETTGLLSPAENVEHLLRQVDRLLADDRSLSERLVGNGRRHAAAFSVDQHVQQLTAIYRVLVRGAFTRDAG
jgi:glycosyltransferase involved in cell wall biosynthesis